MKQSQTLNIIAVMSWVCYLCCASHLICEKQQCDCLPAVQIVVTAPRASATLNSFSDSKRPTAFDTSVSDVHNTFDVPVAVSCKFPVLSIVKKAPPVLVVLVSHTDAVPCNS